MAPEVSAGGAEGKGESDRTADLPARILEVATRSFAEHGWAGTHVRQIAETAGCTPTALYYHYDGKEALWTAAVRAGFGRVQALQRAAHVEGGTVRERLVASVGATVRLAQTERHHLWILYRASRHPEEGQPAFPLEGYREGTRQATARLLEEGIGGGELRADLDVEVAVSLIQGVMEQRLGEYFYDGRPFGERWAERVVEQLFRGLEA